MKPVEWGLATLCVVFAVRSLVIWTRRAPEGSDLVDHLLYAIFVTGRVGLWLAFAGLFAIYASTTTEGRAFADEARSYSWYVLVILVLSAMQFVGGQLLGRRSPAGGSSSDDGDDARGSAPRRSVSSPP